MAHINLNNPISVYFIGIGGISMSGLAKILKKDGFSVCGSDREESDATEDLKSHDIQVFIGQTGEHVTTDYDLVVYTAAIHEDNPELIKAKSLGLPLMTRAELLGEIMDNYKNSITVSGTHGKTTTTSMLTLILMEYTDPTSTIGGVLPAIKSNVTLGKSDVFIAEACEYTNSFFSFHSKYSIILNIEEDHPDFFKDLNDIRNSFLIFSKNVVPGGSLFINSEIPDIDEFRKIAPGKVHTFGFSKDSDISADDIHIKDGKTTFTVLQKGLPLFEVNLSVPGNINVLNALSAISVCLEMGVPKETIINGLLKFTGAHRRLEYRGSIHGCTVIDDYAHHPTEIRASISAIRQHYSGNRLIVCFQSHTYSRTEAYFDDFVDALLGADLCVLCEIFPAREENIHNISAKSMADAIVAKGGNAVFAPEFSDASKFIQKNLINDDVLITMGAGNVYLVGDYVLND